MASTEREALTTEEKVEKMWEVFMRPPQLKVKRLRDGVKIPAYQTVGSSGMDVAACEDTVLAANECGKVRTGLAMQIPDGYEVQVRPRSGVSLRTSLIIPNSPGTIDSDYTGEICIIMRNLSAVAHT
eukprot:CAMPEP_0119143450 /NCGR_PEP_ID=MMETSP1310-20130426/34359_1 /TAXON_ID=464262 /ORGANISM="Genus nov. species nov., Strain RCC2339" /LENGTH=126 /DNA_ID=CAMNT_0007135083 /DNA_START=96 /DNA_END=472 /DNA_ORIENTATION=-